MCRVQDVCGGSQKTTSGVGSHFLPCLRQSHSLAAQDRLAGAQASRDPPASPPHPTAEALESQTCASESSFMWVLGTQAQSSDLCDTVPH